jgi:hypothetical protein
MHFVMLFMPGSQADMIGDCQKCSIMDNLLDIRRKRATNHNLRLFTTSISQVKNSSVMSSLGLRMLLLQYKHRNMKD